MEYYRNVRYWIIYLLSYGTIILCIEEKIKYSIINNYRLGGALGFIEEIDLTNDACGPEMRCLVSCSQKQICQSVSLKKDRSICQLYSVSIAAIGSDPMQDNEWDTYVKGGWHPIVKHSTGESQYNELSISEFYTYEPYTASFPDDDCGIDPAVKCSRPYKHTLKDYLLESNLVKQIKISVYEAGSEAAYVTFTKEPGLHDVWLAGLRVVDSYPWDKNLLQESTALYSFNQTDGFSWLISEGNKYNPAAVGGFSAHANWLFIETSPHCIATERNVILYSKGGEPTVLSTWGVRYAEKSTRYDVSGHDAPSVCSDYLHATIATKEQSDTANSNGFQCCNIGWVSDSQSSTGYTAGYWMTSEYEGCGTIGFNFYTRDVSQMYGVVCAVDTAIVGLADTLVISVKLG